MINDVVDYVVGLDNLITERDDLLGMHNRLEMKIALLQMYSAGEDVTEALTELAQRQSQAAELLEGIEAEILKQTGLEVEQARKKLVETKTVLNTYMEQTSREFYTDHLDEKSAEEVLAVGLQLIEVMNDDGI